MTFHGEVLPAEQRAVLRQLGPVAHALGFYLGGGTAVAMHLGHQQSLDLDWFTGLYSLCYFDDAESAPMPIMLIPVTWEEVKQSLRQWVKSLAG